MLLYIYTVYDSSTKCTESMILKPAELTKEKMFLVNRFTDEDFERFIDDKIFITWENDEDDDETCDYLVYQISETYFNP